MSALLQRRPFLPAALRPALRAGLRWSLAGLLLTLASAPATAARLAISCGAVGLELRLCQEGVAAWSQRSGHTVSIISTPNSATERLSLYLQLLAAGSPDLDVLQIDVIWSGTLASQLLDLRSYVDRDTLDRHFPALIANNTIDDRLVAMPWFTDAGLLYYRKDLLERYGETPPQTWEELTRIARRIQAAERAAGNPRMHGFVFQAKGYEGLSCNALEWIHSFGGGTVIDAGGAVTVNNAHAVAALRLAASWIGDIAPRGVLNYDEEASRGVFQSGQAVFMRNWPYAWALGNAADSPVRGRIGVVALPRGGPQGRHSGTLGGWQLAVSKHSRHPDAAADLVRFLSGFAEQKRRAITGAYNPTLPALYADPAVLAAVPFFGQLRDSFVHAVARPSRVTGRHYNRVSAEFYNSVHDILAGRETPETRLAALERKLQRLSRRWRN